jgi:Coenzyme PQQ synthesis protein D (PqqD)
VKKPLSMSSKFVVARDQVSTDLGGEVAVLNLKAGKYYGLDAVGTRIWSLIQQSRSAEEIRDTLVSEYRVKPERCERDLVALLQSLADAGLIVVEDETPA